MRALTPPVLSLTLSLLLAGAAFAAKDNAEPQLRTQKQAASAAQPEVPVSFNLSLSDIHSFNVVDMEPNDFSVKRDTALPPEMVEFARTALQSDARLTYDFPAQGLLRLKCENDRCSKIRAEVTYGQDGPVVWQKVAQYRKCPLVDFSFLPDNKKFAEKLVSQLSQDYAQAARASRKINIPE